MKGRFFLDVVVGESAAIFQLLSGEDQSLLAESTIVSSTPIEGKMR
jgi:hypothetical protein